MFIYRYSETLQQVKEKGKWISGEDFQEKKNTNNTTASNKVMMPYSAWKISVVDYLDMHLCLLMTFIKYNII